MVDRIRALELAGRLALAYPAAYITDEHASVWADELEPLAEAEAERVVSLLRRRCASAPSVSQMRQTLMEVRQETMSPAVPASSRDPGLPPEELARRVRELVSRWSEPETEADVDSPELIARRRNLRRHVEEARAGGLRMSFAEVAPEDPCDRCDHEARWHKADWHCVHEMGRKNDKPSRCLCDGFFPKPSEQSA